MIFMALHTTQKLEEIFKIRDNLLAPPFIESSSVGNFFLFRFFSVFFLHWLCTFLCGEIRF